MKNDISIKINGFSEEISLQIVDKLKKIINEFTTLDFRRLKNIIITSNFEQDIDKLTTNNQTRFKNRYKTSSDTYASVLTIPNKTDFELILIIKSDFIKNLLEDNKDQGYKNALHIINHELAHIHDNNKKIDVFKDLMKTNSYKGKDSIIYPMAETCWSEYIANYLSSPSALNTDYPKIMAKALTIKIKETSFNIKTELTAYKINKNREDLVESCIEQVESLLKNASYLLGYLHGLNISLEELDYESDYILETSYFKDIWEALQSEFYSIGNIYPNGFINLSIYKNLTFYIEAFYNQMGIVFDENEKEKLKIHIM
ncbi:MAG: hypothetical protein C0625_15030 [Arcobacter sp.]|nr:MAG: hypothetical protein C0625_15030 [Arcobacter sp.]